MTSEVKDHSYKNGDNLVNYVHKNFRNDIWNACLHTKTHFTVSTNTHSQTLQEQMLLNTHEQGRIKGGGGTPPPPTTLLPPLKFLPHQAAARGGTEFLCN